MMRSLFSGVSGLKNHQTRMDVIGNNISNVNTTGFKSSRVTFSDTLNQTMNSATSPTDSLGGKNPKQVGLGSGVAAIDLLFTDGTVQSTGKNTDLCLSGNGLFVVSNGSQTYYTRNGAFEFDANGNYTLPGSGLLVQGWTATNGSLNTNGAVGTINVPAGKSMAASATTTVTYANNLNAASPLIASGIGGTELTDKLTTAGDKVTSGSTYNPVRLTLSDGSVQEGSSYDASWRYGYTTNTTGDSATANSSTAITLHLANGGTATGTSGSRYTVGGTYILNTMSTAGSTGSSNDPDAPIILTMDDGSQHAISDGITYTIGDTYTVGSITGTVASISTTSKITSMDVENIGGGLNVDFYVGGTASKVTSAEGNTATVNSDGSNAVTITYTDGSNVYTATGTSADSPYTVGDDTFTQTLTVPSSLIVTNNNINNLVLNLDNNTSIAIPATGTYNVGDTITYTDNNNTLTTATITSYTVTGTITSLKTTYTVNSIEAVKGYSASTTNPVTLTMTDGSTVQETTGVYTIGKGVPITTTVTVYDTLGNAHSVPIYFTKTEVSSESGNTWTVSIASDGTGTTSITDADGSTTTVTMADTSLQFSTEGKYTSGSGTVTMTLTNGSTGTQTITVDLSAITQYTGNSTINGNSDGYAAGTLESISIDSTGVIIGTYTNGVKQNEAQVAVAQFTNAAGLTKTGDSLYQASNNSGTPNVKTAADLGVKITPSSLEMSNVDIANEFADMIVTQRGFQSNSKMITVGDEMLETVINMKR